jgi:hypothetical protein
MPPKKQQQTKKDKAKKEKSVEDKTFGMKNKNKSAKVQRYIQQVSTQAKHNAEQRIGGVSCYFSCIKNIEAKQIYSPRMLLLKRRHLNKKREKNLQNSLNLFKHLKRCHLVLTLKLFFVFISKQAIVKEVASVSLLTT